MSKRIAAQRGVTLIELMILSVIVGIVAAMAVPRFQTAMERMKVRAAGRDITSTIRLGRSFAVSSKTPFGLFFDDQTLTITLFKDLVNPGSQSFDPGDSVMRVDTLPQEFSWMSTDCGNNVIVFEPNGSADFTGGGNIWTMASTETVIGMTSNTILASTGKVSSTTSVY